ncbi:MAG: dihydrofolate reductase family protein [Chitinophagaceae bacterium]
MRILEISVTQVTDDVSIVHQITNALYHAQIQSIIVEGGAKLLQSFIDEQLWDEARIITNTKLIAGKGLHAPQIYGHVFSETTVVDDRIQTLVPKI